MHEKIFDLYRSNGSNYIYKNIDVLLLIVQIPILLMMYFFILDNLVIFNTSFLFFPNLAIPDKLINLEFLFGEKYYLNFLPIILLIVYLIDGLKKYYGAEKGDETLKFFEVHKSADIIHRQIIKELLGEVCDTDLKKEEALESIDLALSSLNNFLSGMERVYC